MKTKTKPKPKTKPKNVGEWFEMFLAADQKKAFFDIARIATFAENAIWMIWRIHDPVSAVDIVNMRKIKEETGKWPKLLKHDLKDVAREERSATKIARELCPSLKSCVYDAIANNVARLYQSNRFAYLTFQRRLPMSHDLRIRFRERAIVIRRNPDKPQYFQLGLNALQASEDLLWFDIRTSGSSAYTFRWLDDWVEGRLVDANGEPTKHASGGTISAYKRRGKWIWQISLARARYDDERPAVEMPVEGRSLVVWAPENQEVFLRCQVAPQNGRPWRMDIVTSDLSIARRRSDEYRRRMGKNYHQSPNSAAHGHGVQHAIRHKLHFRERDENRTNNWIENRSMSVVRFAIRARCPLIQCEKLSDRDSSKLRLGSFPYYKLVQRMGDKARDVGIEFRVFSGFSAIESLVSVCEEVG